MDALTAVLGVLTVILGLILSAVALSNKIIRGVKSQVRDVLIETGLIRPGPDAANWPNGWHSLPDALHAMWEQQQELRQQAKGTL